MKSVSIKFVLLPFLVLQLSSFVYGQAGVAISGKIKVEKGNLDKVKVVVEKNGQAQRSLSVSGNGRVEMVLDYDADYILSFEKEGYVTKRLAFNTKGIPAEIKNEGLDPFQFEVNVFPQYEGVNTVVFNQPVGKIKFDGTTEDLGYDTDYTKSIQSAMNLVMEQVAQKEKEIAKQVVQATPTPTPVKTPTPTPTTTPTPTPKQVPAQTMAKKIDGGTVETFKTRDGKLVQMGVYTAALYGSSVQTNYGFINLGDGSGARELSKDEFEKYRNQYYE